MRSIAASLYVVAGACALGLIVIAANLGAINGSPVMALGCTGAVGGAAFVLARRLS